MRITTVDHWLTILLYSKDGPLGGAREGGRGGAGDSDMQLYMFK